MSKSIKIQIGAKEYSLQGDNPELVEQAAAVVDKNIRMVYGDAPLESNDANTLLIAALNIAEEYIQINDIKEKAIHIFTESIQKANSRLEIALKQANDFALKV